MLTEPHGRFFECSSRRTRSFADCLAVMCSDGTWHAQVDEFLQSLEPTQWDWLALPGGPAALNAQFASFREHHFAREKLGFLAAAHSTRRIALIAHDFCGHYASKRPLLSWDQMRTIQRRHLLAAVRTVQGWHPKVQVEAYLMRAETDGTCWVEKVG